MLFRRLRVESGEKGSDKKLQSGEKGSDKKQLRVTLHNIRVGSCVASTSQWLRQCYHSVVGPFLKVRKERIYLGAAGYKSDGGRLALVISINLEKKVLEPWGDVK